MSMPTKPKRSTAKASPDGDASSKPIELVVRRGALWRFNTLKKKTAELPVTVLWDRRQSDRRAESEEGNGNHRGPDRRQKPPFTWEVADFVVVGQGSSDPATSGPDEGREASPGRRKKSAPAATRARKERG